MSVSFDGINKGDTVRIEFAAPLKGWVEGEVVDNDGGLRLLMESSGSFSVYYDEIGSITVIEPPIQAGDVAVLRDRTWIVGSCAHGLCFIDLEHPAKSNHLVIGDVLASEAVWLVRGGRLTNRVKASE